MYIGYYQRKSEQLASVGYSILLMRDAEKIGQGNYGVG